MSVDIIGKLAEGKKLSEFEVQFARDRGIPLPESYGVSDTITEVVASRPGEPVVQTGPMPAEGDTTVMTKAELVDFAESQGVEVTRGMTKAEILEALGGGD